MSLNIDIIDVENASELESFGMVTGKWRINAADSERDQTVCAVADSVRNWADSEHRLEVQVFHADGRAITGDIPSSGTFVCQRA